MEKADSGGIYLYCITNHGQRESFGNIGLEGSEVYTIPFKDISATVHRCRARPYETRDLEKAKSWILTHQYVIDLATKRFGTVIPLTFDIILKGDDAAAESWLRDEHDQLGRMLERFKGKAEYGIKFYMSKEYHNESLSENLQISAPPRTLGNKPKGTAYLLQKRAEQKARAQMNMKSEALTRDLGAMLSSFVDEVTIERKGSRAIEDAKDRLMILNLSCLIKDEKVKALGDLLGKLDGSNGLTVKFTGPWPPYSFTSKLERR